MSETIDQPPTAIPARPVGRPRSERADKAIIDATLALLVEECGVTGVTIEAVAGGVSVRDDLIALTRALGVEKGDRQRVGIYWSVFGNGDKHPELHRLFIRDVVEPRRERMRAVLRRGIETGELRPDIDIDLVMWLLMGAVVNRARAWGIGPVPEDFAERLVDTSLGGAAPPRPPPGRRREGAPR